MSEEIEIRKRQESIIAEVDEAIGRYFDHDAIQLLSSTGMSARKLILEIWQSMGPAATAAQAALLAMHELKVVKMEIERRQTYWVGQINHNSILGRELL